MTLQYIPSSSQEIITNTLADAKSIRGFFFVVKDENWLIGQNYQPKVTMSVDGLELCRDLMIMPFCANSFKFQDSSESLGMRMQDYRKVSINTCLNVSESVVRVEPIADNVLDIVLILSDEKVEGNIVEWVDSVLLSRDVVDSSNSANYFLRYKPQSVFAYNKIDLSNPPKLVAYNDTTSLPRTFTVNGNSEICPLSIQEINPTTRLTWRDQQFFIQHPAMDKNIRLNAGQLDANPIYLFFISNQTI